MKTKKLLVPFDFKKPEKRISGFLCPNFDNIQLNSFIQLDKSKEWQAGRVVFVGQDITKEDLFAKIVDSGRKIRSVNSLLQNLEEYLTQIKSLKIGDIIGVRAIENGFELVKLEKPQKPKRSFLP